MKKLLTIYFVYTVGLFLYFYYFYPLESLSGSRYGALSHAAFFAMLPIQVIIIYILLIKRNASIHVGKNNSRLLSSLVFTGMLIGLEFIARLPFQAFWHALSISEGTRTQGFLSWFLELILSTGLYFLIIFFLLYFSLLFMEKWPRRWGIILWLAILPFAIFIVFIQPVWIDPLFDDFHQLKSGKLRTEMEQLTESAGLSDVDILVVNKSEKVTTYNAYVTGIFGHARIVLWDTMLNGMEEAEILFITAHEVAHYLYKHVYIGMGLYLLLSLILLLLLQWLSIKWKDDQIYTRLLKLLLTASIILTITQPVSLFVSRQMERTADIFAMDQTEDLTPALHTYYLLAEQSKTDISPAPLIRLFRSSHPSIRERIEKLREIIENRETNS
ncbi:Zn-dependent protease with chaperone function [Gracilibacillus ureilyticus]|uniref:Zn-dependent protease with chaperone function n=1 Tax=Gracilibacillus ureilyticus TaxID=531814 RepID=A0A1H9SLV8_9BACI|nr:M48 family metalloprotease [Gracilibacillus ureilyticus]SER85868.1 Zn-dependent protease with chaperone function [Gracilibacillus ureilyticus]